MRGFKYNLTEEDRNKILLLLLKGKPITVISNELNIPYSAVRRYFTKWSPENYKKIPALWYGKSEAYHDKEDDYASIPSYKWEELSKNEIDAYNDYRLFKQD